MAVRSFFLGDARMVPRNYRHVLVNPLKIDWLNFGANYNEVVTLAVDEKNADGRAFVTEYAGPSSVVPFVASAGMYDPDAFATVDPAQLGALLEAENLLACDDFGTCAFGHPLMEGLLAQYITLPPGVAAVDYYMNQSAYPDADLTMWNGAEFASKMDEFIIAPAVHAADLLRENPYLTRMFTTISPAEMTEDPMFYENRMQPEVTNQQNGALRILCNGDRVFTLPDGREVYLPDPTWPQFPDEPGGTQGQMRSAQLIEAMPPSGAPMQLVDNTEAIDAVLSAWNEQNGWGEGGGAGCGCTSSGGGSTWLALFGLGGLALGLRTRARRRSTGA
jgi:MYXO-CTERM domain-containing protein